MHPNFTPALPLCAALAASSLWAAAAAAGPAATEAADQTLGMGILSAYVEKTGDLTGGAGVVGVLKNQSGRYFVAFNRSVEGCAYVGSTSGDNAFVYPGHVAARNQTFVLDGTTYNGVQVDTADDDALVADRPFHLIVFCSN